MNLAWIASLLITAMLVAMGRRAAASISLVDTPDDRKKHEGKVPLIGGIAIYLGICTVLVVSGQYIYHLHFLAGAFLIVAAGVWDDVASVSPFIRLIIQSAAIGIVVYGGGIYITDLGHILPNGGLLSLGWLAMPFTIFAGVALINAFNMTDGLDGLCGSLALAALVGSLAMAASVGTFHIEVRFLLILSAALTGFLLFNFPFPGRSQATAFLGDAGSYLLGFSVLYVVIRLSQGEVHAMPPVSALWFCLLPLLDMGGITIRRLMRRRSPFNADREHLHHVFTLAKFSVTETTGIMALIALIGVLIGTTMIVADVPEQILFYAFLAVATMYLWHMIRAWKRLRFLSRSIDRRVRNLGPDESQKDRRSKTEEVVLQVANDPEYERRSGDERRTKKLDEPEEVAVTSLPTTDPKSGIAAGRS